MPAMQIYKVLRQAEWAELKSAGLTDGAPVDVADGYVHFSTAAQLPETLRKRFSGEPELMLLACEADSMGQNLRWERSRGGDLFPHLYRQLQLSDVIWTRLLATGPDGHDVGSLE